jgi:hypothetical protein
VTAGAGGATAGAGGASASAGAGGAGSASPTFAAVKTLFAMSCGTGTCHNKASGQLDFQGTTDLHTMLTTALPDSTAHCKGSILAAPNDAPGSYILTVVKAASACQKGGGNIGRMPDNCKTNGGSPMCLTDPQVKILSDWIAAGAPK